MRARVTPTSVRYSQKDSPGQPVRQETLHGSLFVTLGVAIVAGLIAGVFGVLVVISWGSDAESTRSAGSVLFRTSALGQDDRVVASAINERVAPTMVALYDGRKIAGVVATPDAFLGWGMMVTTDGIGITVSEVPITDQTTARLPDGELRTITPLSQDTTAGVAFFSLEGDEYSIAQFADQEEVSSGMHVWSYQPDLPGRAQIFSTHMIVSQEFLRAGELSIYQSSDEGMPHMAITGTLGTLAAPGIPIVSIQGEIIGMVREEVGGVIRAVTSGTLDTVTAKILAHGNINAASLGVTYIDVSRFPEIGKAFDAPSTTGAFVYRDGGKAIASTSPARELREGDVILSVDGITLDAQISLRVLIQRYIPGETVELTIQRGVETLNMPVTLTSNVH